MFVVLLVLFAIFIALVVIGKSSPEVEVHTYVDGVEVDAGVVSVEQFEEPDGSLTTITTYDDGTVVTDNTSGDFPVEKIDHPDNPIHIWHDDGGPVHPNDGH